MQITGKQVAVGLGVVAGVVGLGALLSACAPKEQDADTFALDKFGGFDKEPKDNKWTRGEVEYTSRPRVSTREVNTYRVGDYVYGTREIRETTTRNSMNRIYEAAKGNDAVLSLKEIRDFALKNFDADKNGTLNRGERNKFADVYGPTSRSRTVIVGTEPFMRHSPRRDYPDPNYPYNPGNGGTSGGDDGGYIPPGGGYVPPSNGGTGGSGGTAGGDDGGTYVPPSSGGSGGTGGSTGSGDSTGNGNPDDSDF